MNKEILELIEPYTDKTLSEGCLLKMFNKQELDKIIYDENYDINDEEHIYIPTYCGSAIEAKEKIEGHKEDDGVIEKILGHYDITSLLKLINDKFGDFNIRFNTIEIYKYPKSRKTFIGKIPNKPLHLYTEQEEILLLEILKNLGQN